MNIKKIYNNNVVYVVEEGQEYVVMGKGIGFKKRVGDSINPNQIDRKFVLEDDTTTNNQLFDIYFDLSGEETETITAIIQLAETTLNQSFDSTLFITLADHLHYAMKRVRAGVEVSNPLKWEIKRIYTAEYAIGEQALKLIADDLGVLLNEDEAATIALHIVNAQKDGKLPKQTVEEIKLIQDILRIVYLRTGTRFDESTTSYQRFIRHLQFFASRVTAQVHSNNEDDFMFDQVTKRYPEAYAIALKIKEHLASHYDFDIDKDEQVYLTVHLNRLIQDS